MNDSVIGKDYCFCTLALGGKYTGFARDLAMDIAKYFPGVKFVVLTDKPAGLSTFDNVLAFRHKAVFPLFPFNDKVFVFKKALSLFSTAIYLDADSRILSPLPPNINWPEGIITPCDVRRNMSTHCDKFYPQVRALLEKLHRKLKINVALENCFYPIPCQTVVTRDSGKEAVFLEIWEKAARYLAVHRCKNVMEGYAMGLAMAKTGWEPLINKNQEILAKAVNHFGAQAEIKNMINKSKRKKMVLRLNYWKDWFCIWLHSLRDPKFYYW